MIRHILPISALLLGSALLVFAGGINTLILPVRGSQEGFTSFSLGLLGTGWAIGYIAGCLYTPKLVANVGHIRAFGALCSFCAVVVLGSLLLMTPWAWVPLRALSGFCFAGTAMIVESWLGERATAANRGKIFGFYTMINLGATTAGQMTLTLGDTTGYLFFVLAAMVYSLALIPTTISSSTSPKPLVSVRLDIRALWRNSPVAVFAVVMIGISNSAFGALAAVYGDRIGLVLATIALFTSVPILAGAAAQIPVGALSDRMDRRKVLIGIAAVAICADLAFVLLHPQDATTNLVISAVLGAAIYAMYPVIVAHANDHAAPDTYIQTSGGLLLLYGVGGIIGPLIAGLGMTNLNASALFMTTMAAHVLIVGFTVWRMTQRSQVSEENKVVFAVSPLARTSTPETAALASADDPEGNHSQDL
jgi:MFS family permease